MKTIVAIDDDKTFLHNLYTLWNSLQFSESSALITFSSLDAGIDHILSHHTDLILLDIDFSSEGRSALSSLDLLPPVIPIILLSNLTHYQKFPTSKANICAFISKQDYKEQLSSVLPVYLFPEKTVSLVDTLTVPRQGIGSPIQFTLPVRNLQLIEYNGSHHYTAYTCTESVIPFESTIFRAFLVSLYSQHIPCLLQANRNQIINANYIRSIYRSYNSRIHIQMMNPSIPEIIVGQQHQAKFEKMFTIL